MKKDGLRNSHHEREREQYLIKTAYLCVCVCVLETNNDFDS